MTDSQASPAGRVAVDPRILQANERTLLAWLRTGIALITFGFVIARLGAWLELFPTAQASAAERQGAAWVGAAFVAIGALTNGMAVARFIRNRRALLRGEELPADPFPVMFGGVVTALGAVLGAYVLTQLAW